MAEGPKPIQERAAKTSSCRILGRLCHPLSSRTALRHIEMVVRPQMLNQVVATRETIAVLADASLDRAVLEDRVVDAGLMPLQVRWPSERPAALADVGLRRSRQTISIPCEMRWLNLFHGSRLTWPSRTE